MYELINRSESRCIPTNTVMGAADIVITVVIFIMVCILIFPFAHMNTVVSGIIDTFGDQKNNHKINNHEINALVISTFTSKTKLHDVVCLFNKMI